MGDEAGQKVCHRVEDSTPVHVREIREIREIRESAI
jgi:hypothetical protein